MQKTIIKQQIDNLNEKMLMQTDNESVMLSKTSFVDENKENTNNNNNNNNNNNHNSNCDLGLDFVVDMRNLSAGQDKYSSKKLMETETNCLRNIQEKQITDKKFFEQQLQDFHEDVSEAESIAFEFDDKDVDFSQSANCLDFSDLEQENEQKEEEEGNVQKEILKEEDKAVSEKKLEQVKLRKHSSDDLSKSNRSKNDVLSLKSANTITNKSIVKHRKNKKQTNPSTKHQVVLKKHQSSISSNSNTHPYP